MTAFDGVGQATSTTRTVGVDAIPNGVGAARDAKLTVGFGSAMASRHTVAYGRADRVRGRLTTAAGAPIAGATLQISTRVVLPRRGFRPVTTAVTAADGSFSYLAPRGPSRQVRVDYTSFVGDAAPAASRLVRMSTKAGVHLTARKRGDLVRFSGRLRGGPKPTRGLLVVLQGLQPGYGWRTFRTARTSTRRTLCDVLPLPHHGSRHVPVPRHGARADRLRVHHRSLARSTRPASLKVETALAHLRALCWVKHHMRPARLLCAAATTAAFACSPALASAAPPANDNYLSSIPMALNQTVTTTVDTTEATTQPDLFNPNRDGQPLGGGPVEPPDCKGAPVGKTVWYDLAPTTNFGVALRATAAFGAVLAVYEWNPTDSKLKGLVDCTANATDEDLLLDLEAKKSYTIQVGGVAGAGGALSLKAEFFPDTDADSVYDPIDDCPTLAGVGNSGCPPKLVANPRLPVSFTGTGVLIDKLFVERVPKGAKIVVRCAGCGSQTVRAKRQGTVSLPRFAGRALAAGKELSVRVTMAPSGTGKYRFGATGVIRRWIARAGAIKQQPDRCLNAKTSKIERCK